MSTARKEKEASAQGTRAAPDGVIWAPAPHLGMRALTEPRSGWGWSRSCVLVPG